jgi:hypothetical protein
LALLYLPFFRHAQPSYSLWLPGRNLEGNGRSLIEVLARYSPGGTKEKHENLSEDSRCVGRDSNQISPEQKSKAFPLYQSDLYQNISCLTLFNS